MRQSSAEEQRIAEKVWQFWSGQPLEAVSWLLALGCKLAPGHEVVSVAPHSASFEFIMDGLVGVRCGLTYPSGDPISVAVMFGFLLAGQFWPMVYPGIMDLTKERWKASRG